MPRDALPHDHLHLIRPQRGDGERRDTLSLRAQAVQDEGEIPAPDLGADPAGQLRGLGQNEQDERDVGRPEVGPELARGLDPLDQPGHPGRIALPGVPDPVTAVGGVHQQLPQAAVAGQHLGCLLQKAGQAGPGIRRLGGFLGQRRHGVDTFDEQRLDQVLLGAEPPVHGAHPDAGVPGHLGQADVQAALGEVPRRRLEHALNFGTADRQWVVAAYTLAFGSLLLLGGRLADLLGRKVTFMVGLLGFAGVSAIGGASVNFAMLVTARACQGVFAALLVPSALSLLTTTFTEPKDRGKAFGVYGAIAAAGGAVRLLLGGPLPQDLSWRWTLYLNLFFASVAFAGAAVLLERRPSPVKPKLDIPGVVMVSGAVFCLVYGFSNAATHNWHTPSTWGFLIVGVALLAGFAYWMGRSSHPLLPPRVVLDRNRGGAYASMVIASAGMFPPFLFLPLYPPHPLRFTPSVSPFLFPPPPPPP